MKKLALEHIKQDLGIQQRVGGLDPARVEEYASDMRDGDTFPPVVVYHDLGPDEYWLSDGFHRCVAATAAGITEIDAEVQIGTRRDALLHALGANAVHGARFTNKDKRKAVFTMLLDETWTGWSDRKISQHTHTSQPFVSGLRKELAAAKSPVREDATKLAMAEGPVHEDATKPATAKDPVHKDAKGKINKAEKTTKPRAAGLIKVWERAEDDERSKWIQAVGLTTVWTVAKAEERTQWITDNRKEIEDLLHKTGNGTQAETTTS